MELKFVSKPPVGGVFIEKEGEHRIFMIVQSTECMVTAELMTPIRLQTKKVLRIEIGNRQLLRCFVPLNFNTKISQSSDSLKTYMYGDEIFTEHSSTFTQKSFGLLLKCGFNFKRYFGTYNRFMFEAYDIPPNPDRNRSGVLTEYSLTTGQRIMKDGDLVEFIRYSDPAKTASHKSVTYRYVIQHKNPQQKGVLRSLLGKLMLNEEYDRSKEYVYIEVDLATFFQYYYPVTT